MKARKVTLVKGYLASHGSLIQRLKVFAPLSVLGVLVSFVQIDVLELKHNNAWCLLGHVWTLTSAECFVSLCYSSTFGNAGEKPLLDVPCKRHLSMTHMLARIDNLLGSQRNARTCDA
eukprot:1439380-Amphidinium_carterae.1